MLKIQPEEIVSAYTTLIENDLETKELIFQVNVKVEYSNSYLITDRKLIKMHQDKDYIKYELWSVNYSKKVCPKIYMPVDMVLLI